MDYYQMIMRMFFISFGVAGGLSIGSTMILNMYIGQIDKKVRSILRLENLALNLIALISVFILTEESPAAFKISMIYGGVTCICIDIIFCKSNWIFNWIMPEVDELR